MKILKINSSSNRHNSITRQHVNKIVDILQNKGTGVTLTERDVAYSGLTFIDDNFLGAAFSQEPLTDAQREALALSDSLIQELMDHDTLVIGAPMYNFTVPASLKAYFDLFARVGKTFKYTENGPVGLVEGKKAYVVISTGGTPIGSPYDFSKAYIQTFLGFLGIQDIEFLILDENNSKMEEKLEKGRAFLETI